MFLNVHYEFRITNAENLFENTKQISLVHGNDIFPLKRTFWFNPLLGFSNSKLEVFQGIFIKPESDVQKTLFELLQSI